VHKRLVVGSDGKLCRAGWWGGVGGLGDGVRDWGGRVMACCGGGGGVEGEGWKGGRWKVERVERRRARCGSNTGWRSTTGFRILI